ncbi:MAG: FAD-dependent monooxygenase [Balneolaceae bacterium]|nr:FAD-dependent monooxygenase [Balneolaceae bacterium]
MTESARTYDVIIVGGGPVGLFLAIILLKKGIECIVLEKRTERTTHSKSLGIHPVSLELMDQMKIADPFVKEGIKIRRGVALDDHGKIGSISFDSCPGPFPYVLSLPQYRTEYLLEKQLEKLDASCLRRGVEFQDLNQTNMSVSVTVKEGENTYQLSARVLAGCDGKNSVVRQSTGFSFEGRAYPDTYIMGDFSDTTDFGTSAAIYLHSRGLIESFPLIDNRRRWVIKTDQYYDDLNRRHLEKILRERIGLSLNGCDHFMLSSFGVQKHLAKPIARNRVFTWLEILRML